MAVKILKKSQSLLFKVFVPSADDLNLIEEALSQSLLFKVFVPSRR